MSGAENTSWSPDLYLKFQEERTQPSRDLVHRIGIEAPGRILDAGCGPGNSTQVLAERWPGAEIIGVDSSDEMIEKARAGGPAGVTWVKADLREYAPAAPYDIVFSNAVIQWIPDHRSVLARLFGMVAPGGVLAIQVPLYHQMPVRLAIAEVAGRPQWRETLSGADSSFTFREPEFYYDAGSELSGTLALWETRYIHEMPSAGSIVEMMRSTGLREYLRRLPAAEQQAFVDEVQVAVEAAYPRRQNGRVLFAFRRFFMIVSRPD